MCRSDKIQDVVDVVISSTLLLQVSIVLDESAAFGSVCDLFFDLADIVTDVSAENDRDGFLLDNRLWGVGFSGL